MTQITFRANQELKAFRKTKKKTYTVESSTKLLTPWVRTLHPTFSLTDLNINKGDKIIVSTAFGSNELRKNEVMSTDVDTIYNHISLPGNFSICNDGLLIEFDSIPNVLYYTIISKKIFEPKNDCNC